MASEERRRGKKKMAISLTGGGGGGTIGGVVVWGGALAAATLISAFAISRRRPTDKDPPNPPVVSMKLKPTEVDCAESDKGNQGLRSLLQNPSSVDQNSSQNSDGTSKMRDTQIEYSKLATTEILISEDQKPEPQANGWEESLSLDHQEILFSDDGSEDTGIGREESSLPGSYVDSRVRSDSCEDTLTEGNEVGAMGEMLHPVDATLISEQGRSFRQLIVEEVVDEEGNAEGGGGGDGGNEEEDNIAEESSEGEDASIEEAIEEETENDRCETAHVGLLLEDHNPLRQSFVVIEEEEEEEEDGDDDEEEEEIEEESEEGENEFVETSEEEEEDDDEEDEDIEENGESSEETRSSSVESTAEAIWPAETIEDLPMEFKKMRPHVQSPAEKIEVEEEMVVNEMTRKSIMSLNKRETDELVSTQLAYAAKLMIRKGPMLVLMLMLVTMLLLAHQKAMHGHFLNHGESFF
ncbi:uncharacterized protein LOC131155766 [Malania oleifera]|uniref:uncharacterized protein LOC131155766 n=1 Tax=Malania oleifera TaxID=397392 RepID=UPI0025AE8E39|nr:uncharacterized protein LOC131155766 [Malania oleifera]